MDKTLETKIRESVERYFKFYASSPDANEQKTKEQIDYVFACCKYRLSKGLSPRDNRDSIDRFVLETVFTHCINEGARPVKTPLGNIVAYPAQHFPNDNIAGRPALYIDISNDESVGTMLACIEYLPPEDNGADNKRNGSLEICVYGDCASDEPTHIRNFANVSAAFDD